MSRPIVQQLPPAPQRGEDFQAFTEKANAHVAALTPWTDDVNELAAWVNATAEDADASATAAAASAALASSASSLAHYKGEWGTLSGALSIPASVWYLEQFWILLESVPDVTAHEPGTSLVWTVAEGSSLANAHAVALSF